MVLKYFIGLVTLTPLPDAAILGALCCCAPAAQMLLAGTTQTA